MSAKRVSSRAGSGSSSGTPGGSSGSDHAITNALLLSAAVGCGLFLLIQKGRLTWPPIALLSSLTTLAGCLALVGPLILARSGARGSEGGLGELIWLTGGLLLWLFDIAGTLQGQLRPAGWATPLGDRTMGLTILAVLLSGWRLGLSTKSWSWTNVTGWALGVFWVGMAIGSWFLAPSSAGAWLASR